VLATQFGEHGIQPVTRTFHLTAIEFGSERDERVQFDGGAWIGPGKASASNKPSSPESVGPKIGRQASTAGGVGDGVLSPTGLVGRRSLTQTEPAIE
jgi:hypothetical protein